MLEEFTIISGNSITFNQYSKTFNVNMEKNRRMVHKKGECHNSTGMYKFIPFDSIDEISLFEKTHNIEFSYCADCFKRGRK